MRKVIIPLVIVAAILSLSAVKAQAATVTLQLVQPTTSTWQVWATDSLGDNLGIQDVGFTLTPATGSILTTQIRTPYITIDNTGGMQDGNVAADTVGFTTAQTAAAGGGTNFTIAEGNTVGYSANEFLMAVGQTAGNVHAHYTAIGDPNYQTDCPGDDGSNFYYQDSISGGGAQHMLGDLVGTYTVAASGSIGTGSNKVTNPFSSAAIELASGTNSTGATFAALTSLSGNVWNIAPAGLSSTGDLAAASVVQSIPEPASLALLAMGGLLVLPRRRQA